MCNVIYPQNFLSFNIYYMRDPRAQQIPSFSHKKLNTTTAGQQT
jgi:hypothetical protein